MLRAISIAAALLVAPASAQTIADDTGLSALIQRLGAGNVPTGAGVSVGQIEASAPGYLPDVNNAEFAGKSIVAESSGMGVSGHATTVGRHFYGLSTSIAPGIDEVHCWEANNWTLGGFLNGTGSTPPDLAPFKVMNHSWIGGGLNPATQLRKLDYAIREQDLVTCVGVNNGSGGLDQPLLSHAFNVISVGRSDGSHRAGGTAHGIEVPGRHKPELVAPASATSFSTPLVAGAAALLVETARSHPDLASDPDAERADVIKAALMAGALHRPGWDNGAPSSGPARGITDTPMDALWGVDQVNVDRSHWILTGGPNPSSGSAAGAPPARHAGWDRAAIDAGARRFWRFEVAATKPYVSILAAWQREVAPNFSGWSCPDLDLELWRVDSGGNLVGLTGDAGAASFASGNVQSVSLIENVEHLYLRDLAPGEYALELRRMPDAGATWTAAVAWELDCAEPFAYGTAKTTSLGLAPALTWRGIASGAVDEFVLEVTDAVPGNNGLVFWGHGQAALPFLGGTLLVQPPVTRLPAITLDASGAGSIPVPLDSSMAGETRNYQFWFRDPAHPDGTGVGLSNAVEVPICY